jgi:HlyD family secretion protein
MDRKIEKKKWTVKKILTIGGGGFFSLFIIWQILWGDHSSRLNVKNERITISTVTKGPFQEYIPVTGEVIPIKTVYLDAIEGGSVETVFLEAGSLIKEGDAILKLQNTDLLLNILYREADLAEQSNALRNTRLEMERRRLDLRSQLAELNFQIKQQKRVYEQSEKLFENSLISKKEFEDARDQYDYLREKQKLTIESHKQDSIFREIQIQNLESSLDRMKDNLQLIKQKLENLTIRAPISGQLTSLIPEIGESMAQGERIGQIDVLEGFKVRVDIDEHYISRINVDQGGEFELKDTTYCLLIKKIYPEVHDGRFTVNMEFVSRLAEGIRRGQTLHIRLELGDLSEATLLPRGGFYQTTGGQWVYLVDPSGEYAVKQEIKLGRQNPQVFEVLEGLQFGDKVITSSYDTYGSMDKLILEE